MRRLVYRVEGAILATQLTDSVLMTVCRQRIGDLKALVCILVFITRVKPQSPEFHCTYCEHFDDP